MRIFNSELITHIILPGFLGSTLWSSIIAIGVGSIIGLIVGAIKHRLRQTVVPAIAGSFFGTMIVCMLPILSTPGIVGGGAYGGLIIMLIASITLPIGALGGAIVGSLIGPEQTKAQQKKLLAMLLGGTYLCMGLVIFTSISLHCSRPNTLPDYCTKAGYPRAD